MQLKTESISLHNKRICPACIPLYGNRKILCGENDNERRWPQPRADAQHNRERILEVPASFTRTGADISSTMSPDNPVLDWNALSALSNRGAAPGIGLSERGGETRAARRFLQDNGSGGRIASLDVLICGLHLQPSSSSHGAQYSDR